MHRSCDGKGRPLLVVVTTGRRHESTQLGAVDDAAIRIARSGCGRPRERPEHLIADKDFKQWRGLATRYEKRAANYGAVVGISRCS